MTQPDSSQRSSPPWIDRFLASLARLGHRRPWHVLAVSLVVLGLSWGATSRLDIRGDFLELLPSESEGAKLFRRSMARMGGASSSMFVVVSSPDARANQAIVNALEPQLRALPPRLVRTVEHGPEEIRRFYTQQRWLFAEVGDLEEVACELDRAHRRAQPGFVDLDDEPCSAQRSDRRAGQGSVAPSAASTGAAAAPTSPFVAFRDRMDARVREVDQFPTGYFRNDDGSLYAIVMRSPGTATGDASGDELMRRVREIVAATNPTRFHPQAQVGYGGDIPNAAAERDALVKDAALSSGLAITLILLCIVVFFRSLVSLVHIGIAMFTGVGMAFAVAYFAFGHLNASTAFLGSIIAGNGINYGIIFLARYRERRGAGDDVESALVDAAVTVRVGTQLAAFAAAAAYGSLMITTLKGFSQFGLIGGVGMLVCWLATMTVVPASVSAWERLRTRLWGRHEGAVKVAAVRAPISNFIGQLTTRYAVWVVAIGLALTALATVKLPRYAQDPWEYNFSKLGSRGSRRTGAEVWSYRARQVFRGSGRTPDILLADSIADVPSLTEALRQRDLQRTGGRYIERVETVFDRLGGTPEVVQQKLALLGRIRTRIDEMRPYLSPSDAEIANAWRPPSGLRVLGEEDLPRLVREQFTERDGRFGTPIFVHYKPSFSRNDGRQLMVVADLTQNLRLRDGRVVPTVSRATVFAEMVKCMMRDGPLATVAALLSVVGIVLLATRNLRASVSILGSLVGGVLLTMGGAAWLGVRLNFLNFVALPLTFGIGVEYAINLYDRLRFTRGDVAAAVRSVGGAVTLCSMTTVIGYGALLVSDNQALQSFGALAIAGELACIVTAMLLLPATLRLLGLAPSAARAWWSKATEVLEPEAPSGDATSRQTLPGTRP
ncbi:MAG: MMPL family transporter [Myxococcales bacterium]|nr:MMPL family transporter [Myxococcales bacterium]